MIPSKLYRVLPSGRVIPVRESSFGGRNPNDHSTRGAALYAAIEVIDALVKGEESPERRAALRQLKEDYREDIKFEQRAMRRRFRRSYSGHPRWD